MENVLIIKGCFIIDGGEFMIGNNYDPCKSSCRQDLCLQLGVLIHNNRDANWSVW